MKSVRLLLWAKIGEMLVDALLVLLAFTLAYFLRIGFFLSTDFPFEPYFLLALAITPLFVLLFFFSGLYSLREQSSWDHLRIIALSCLAGVMIFVLIFFFKRDFFFSRKIVVYVFLLSTVLILAFHLLLGMLSRRRHRQGGGVFRTLIIGNKNAAHFITEKLKDNGSQFQVVVALSPYGGGPKEVAGAPVLGKLDALERIVESERIDAIIQTEAVEHTLSIISLAEGRFLECLIAPQILGIFDRQFSAERVGGLPFVRLQSSPLFGWGIVFKRFLDLLLSLILLPLVLLLFPFLGLKKDTVARGVGEQVFTKYNYRKPTGMLRFFPELINVFLGQMSVVGPRPRSPEEREHLTLYERKRLVVKPGILGLWQMQRLLGKTEEEVLWDLRYIRQWSLWLDLQIFMKSLVAILSRRGSRQE